MTEVVETNLDCPILAGSMLNGQVENGIWKGLDNTVDDQAQVEDGLWQGLDNNTVSGQVEDGVWKGL